MFREWRWGAEVVVRFTVVVVIVVVTAVVVIEAIVVGKLAWVAVPCGFLEKGESYAAAAGGRERGCYS